MRLLKSVILISSALLFSTIGMAAPGWKVVYKYVLPAPELDLSGVPEEYRDQIKASHQGEDIEEEHTLYLDGDISAYSTQPGAFSKKRFVLEGKNSIYVNRKENRTLGLYEVDGKEYLVEGKGKAQQWEVGTETKVILGRKCTKATQAQGAITAWFCPEIPIPAGPMVHKDLPGLVLEVSMGKRGYSIIATSLEQVQRAPEIVLPKGKAITEQEYEKKVDDWIKSLEKMGNVTIYR